MIIIALIPPLPHLPIITCKPYYQPYLLSEHKMPPRFGTPEQTKKGPTPELLWGTWKPTGDQKGFTPNSTKKPTPNPTKKNIPSSKSYP